ncbi:Uncharacterised protein [Bacteroides heparinolyticus]|uniref:Uncharacterized protein n=1 Tax=Prevotella heparinolytica TaxID=28113 RepID=A0A449I5I6_9BACE|nr:Uncharacterised protein [Bacteroides heparinolyticus]
MYISRIDTRIRVSTLLPYFLTPLVCPVEARTSLRPAFPACPLLSVRPVFPPPFPGPSHLFVRGSPPDYNY